MARIAAGDRVQRILAMVPWIVAHDGPTVSEVCARFDLAPKQLLADLEALEQVGVYPYTPGDFVTVIIEGDRIWIHYAEYFRRPLRLTPEEGLALVAAGQALRSVEGADPDGPLARALAKVARSLRVDPTSTDVVLGRVPSETLDLLRTAVAERRAVAMAYYAFGRDELTRRVVEPSKVFADQGQWYLAARCRLAEGERVFRVDRISEARLLDERFESVVEPGSLAVFQPRPDDPEVTLRLAPTAQWVVEQYPVRQAATLDDGRVEVTLTVSARPWLERLLLRLGPDAEVVAADADLEGAAASAAARVLARYGVVAGGG